MGRFAGAKAGVEPAAGWDNHRWIRFRGATGGLSDWLAGFERGYPSPPAPTTPYETMLSNEAEQPSYKIEGGRRTAAEARVAGLRVGGASLGVETGGRPDRGPAVAAAGTAADRRGLADSRSILSRSRPMGMLDNSARSADRRGLRCDSGAADLGDGSEDLLHPHRRQHPGRVAHLGDQHDLPARRRADQLRGLRRQRVLHRGHGAVRDPDRGRGRLPRPADLLPLAAPSPWP